MAGSIKDRLIGRIKNEDPSEDLVREVYTHAKKIKEDPITFFTPPNVSKLVSAGWTEHPEFLDWCMACEPKDFNGRRWSFKEEDQIELADNSVDLLKDKVILFGEQKAGFEVFEVRDHNAKECARLKADDPDLLGLQRVVAPTLMKEGLAINSKKMRVLWDYAKAHLHVEDTALPSICDVPLEIAKDEGWTLNRITTLPDASMPCPSWRAALDRMDDGVAFAAFCWGIYSDQNPGNRQVLWIEGPGEDGKSTLLDVFGSLFGNATSGMKWANIKDSPQFIVSMAAEKRFCYIPDCKNEKLILSESFQQMADGIGLTVVNFKYGKMVQMRIAPRWMVGSNYKPHLIREIYNLSRTLWITIKKFSDDVDPAIDQKLKDELPGFLAYAKECYAERCPDDYEIKVNEVAQAKVNEHLTLMEEEYEMAFGSMFTLDPEGSLTRTQMREALKDYGWRPKVSQGPDDQKPFKDWLAKTHGIKPTGEEKVYRGIRLLSKAEIGKQAAKAATPNSEIKGPLV